MRANNVPRTRMDVFCDAFNEPDMRGWKVHVHSDQSAIAIRHSYSACSTVISQMTSKYSVMFVVDLF